MLCFIFYFLQRVSSKTYFSCSHSFQTTFILHLRSQNIKQLLQFLFFHLNGITADMTTVIEKILWELYEYYVIKTVDDDEDFLNFLLVLHNLARRYTRNIPKHLIKQYYEDQYQPETILIPIVARGIRGCDCVNCLRFGEQTYT